MPSSTSVQVLSRPTLRFRTLFLVVSAAALCVPSTDAWGRQNIRDAFFAAYPTAQGTQLITLPSSPDHCGVCHYDFGGAGTRNPYGLLVEAALPNFPGNPTGRRNAILSVEAADAEGDGYSTLIEVTDTINFTNTPTFPGLDVHNVGSTAGVNPADLALYLTPSTGVDTEPPTVTVFSPNGGEAWLGGALHPVTWTATDDVAVTSIDIDYWPGSLEGWKAIARGVPNSGSFDWFVHHTPTTGSRVRVTARDAAGNVGSDESDTDFSILQILTGIAPTTLRDFEMPGSHPFDAGNFSGKATCTACHGGYDPESEPSHGFGGSMMGYSMLDPLFLAALTVAEQDAPSSGDLCLRCHSPFGWLAGRSNPTDGSGLVGIDLEGVSCEFCHRMVDPIYVEGVSPAEDEAVLALIDVPLGYSNGQFVEDPQARRRGPYEDVAPPHAFLPSAFHRSSDICGTCHDVSNPVFERTSGADYAPGPLDEAAAAIDSEILFPLERTYSEWKHSEFAVGNGVFAPEFAGNLPDGYVSSCQDCHMVDVEGRGAAGAPIRSDLGFHDLTGGSSWMLGVLAAIRPEDVDPGEAADGAARAVGLLQLAAKLDLEVTAAGDGYEAAVTVTNRTGHKLPTGYPEGRRIWIHVVARDGGGVTVYESGAWDPATGILDQEGSQIYEAKLGISPALASALGAGAGGESFHFTLNDTLYKDNRIPPLGFTNAAFDLFGGAPVDAEWAGPGPRYPDDQNWDTTVYPLPGETRTVKATLYYQSTSKEYVEFLRDENTTNDTGQVMYDLWETWGRCAPVAMVADSVDLDVTGTPPLGAVAELRLFPETNPFRDAVVLRLDLPRPSPARIEVFDSQGRSLHRIDLGVLAAGPYPVRWDGTDRSGRDVGSGVFWVRAEVGGAVLREQVVRLR